MPDIIETLLLRNLQEVFGEGDPTRRRAAIEKLYTEDCAVLLPSAVMSATQHSIGSPASCAPLIQTSSTRHMARHRPFKTAGASHGTPGRPASSRATQGSMSLSFEDGKIAALYVFLNSPPA